MKFLGTILFAASLTILSSISNAVTPPAPLLGDLQKPIESLGAITALNESILARSNTPIAKLVDENDCQRKIVLPDEQPPLTAGDLKVARFLIEVSGPGCPVAYSMSLEGQQEPEAFTAKFSLKYEAISAEAKKLYDVDLTDIEGVLNAKVLQAPGGQGGGIEFTFSYKGKGNSQSQGPFTGTSGFDGKMLMSLGSAGPFNLKIEGGFNEAMQFNFKNQSATLKSTTTMNGFVPTMVFEVNGTKVTESEYKTIRDQIKLPGMDGNALGGAGPGGAASTLECKVEVFGSRDFSLPDAEKFIRNGGAKPAPLKVSRSCGGMATDMDQIDGVPYTARFTESPGHTSVHVELCAPGALCGVADRTFLSDESATYADDLLRRFTVLTSCTVVPACTP